MNDPTYATYLPNRLYCCIPLLFLALSLTACTSAPKTGKHLFILSGQSNMTKVVRNAFTEEIQKHYGQDNATIVFHCKPGRGIRFWVADYGMPSGHKFADKKRNSNGQEYDRLIKATKAAASGQSFDTVGFIWMQGESDGLNQLSQAYEESFWKLINRLEKDLGRDDLYFVIGRISDYGLDGPRHDHWQRVREVQVRLGESQDGAWIDTDDLNGGNADRPNGELHYPKEGAAIVGQRFAEKAIEMIEHR